MSANKTFTDKDITRLKQLISEGVQVKSEIDILNGGLKDTVKAVAEELDLKAAQLNKAINMTYKQSLQEEVDKMDELVEIIEAASK